MTVFVFLLAFGILGHKNHLAEWASLPFPFATAVLAVALLFTPNSPRLFLAFVVSLVAETLWYSPFIVNHMLLCEAFAIAIVGAYVMVYRQRRGLPLSVAELERYTFPVIRAGTFVLFFFAVLHKLNYGFFDIGGSCSMSHYDSMREAFPVLPGPQSTVVGSGVVVGSLLMESAIPLLLLFRRTRLAGVIVAFAFHYFIASHQARAFSALSLALYSTFLWPDFYVTLNGVLADILRRPHGRIMRFALPVAMAGLTAISIVSAAYGRTFRTYQLGNAVFYVAALGLFTLFCMAAARHVRQSGKMPHLPLPSHAWQRALITLLVFNGFAPYLGLQTQNVYSMFSNLRTEADSWNHVFMPRGLRVFHFQDSLVEIMEVDLGHPGPHVQTENALGFHRNYDMSQLVPNTLSTEFEFRRSIGLYCREGHGPVRLRYTKDGTVYSIPNACDDPQLRTGNNWLLEKLMRFRHPVPRSNRCPATT